MNGNRDYRDLLQCLNETGARYSIVGAYAVIYHTEPRYTKDLDLWTEPTPENAVNVWNALVNFGAPLGDLTVADLCNPDIVFQIFSSRNIMSDSSNKIDQSRPRVIMSRVSSRAQHGDRSFDIEFWQKIGDVGRFAAAWQMIKEVQLIRGQKGELPRMQKNVTRIIRRSEVKKSGEDAAE